MASQNIAHNIENSPRSADVIDALNTSFETLLLKAATLQGLRDGGFQKPAPIQTKAIPIGKCGLDMIVESKSGTGKTAVFAVIALEMLDLSKADLQSVIVAPTREIAVQITEVINVIGAKYKDLKVHSFIGGMPLETDFLHVENCHIAVGTPGRLRHLLECGSLNSEAVRLFVMDEADKLLQHSYLADINFIYKLLPKAKQFIAVSATYPDKLDRFLEKFMHRPTRISTIDESGDVSSVMLLGLRQFVTTVRNVPNQMLVKNAALIQILSRLTFTQCLVFTNYQTRVESISNALNIEGFPTTFISGAQTQPERLNALADLRKFNARVILSTDLTARGIDASNVDLVVNYDVPVDECTYLHRMGRAGRYGSRGLCITLAATGKEVTAFRKLIGAICGGSGSVAEITDLANLQSDQLWNGNLLDFTQVVGISSEAANMQAIHMASLELKMASNDVEPGLELSELASQKKYSKEELIHIRDNIKDYSKLQVNFIKRVDGLIKVKEISARSVSDNQVQASNGVFKQAHNEDSVDVDEFLAQLIRKAEDEELGEGTMRKKVNKFTLPASTIKSVDPKIFNSLTKLLDDDDIPGNDSEVIKDVDILLKLVKNEDHFPNPVTNETAAINDQSVQTASIAAAENDLKSVLDDEMMKVRITIKDSATSCTTTADIHENEENSPHNSKKAGLFKSAFDYLLSDDKSKSKHWLDVLGEEFDDVAYDKAKRDAIIGSEKENLLEDFHNVDFEELEKMYEIGELKVNKRKRKQRGHRKDTAGSTEPDYTRQNSAAYQSEYSYSVDDYSNLEMFTTHFDECRREFHAKLKYNPNVDEWISAWRAKLDNVRNYTHNRIYSWEMNKYEYNHYNGAM